MLAARWGFVFCSRIMELQIKLICSAVPSKPHYIEYAILYIRVVYWH